MARIRQIKPNMSHCRVINMTNELINKCEGSKVSCVIGCASCRGMHANRAVAQRAHQTAAVRVNDAFHSRGGSDRRMRSQWNCSCLEDRSSKYTAAAGGVMACKANNPHIGHERLQQPFFGTCDMCQGQLLSTHQRQPSRTILQQHRVGKLRFWLEAATNHQLNCSKMRGRGGSSWHAPQTNATVVSGFLTSQPAGGAYRKTLCPSAEMAAECSAAAVIRLPSESRRGGGA